MRRGRNHDLKRAIRQVQAQEAQEVPAFDGSFRWPAPRTRFEIPHGRHPSLVYVIVSSLDRHLAKIGTTTNLGVRLRALQTGSPAVLRVVATCVGGRELESALHELFARHRHVGEWFFLAREPGALLLAILHAAEPAADALRRSVVARQL